MDVEAMMGRSLAELAPLLVLMFFVSGLFLYCGGAVAGAPSRSYGRALLTILLAGILGKALSTILPASPLSGVAVGLVALLVLTRYFFRTDFWRALVTCLVGGVLTAVVVVLIRLALLSKA